VLRASHTGGRFVSAERSVRDGGRRGETAVQSHGLHGEQSPHKARQDAQQDAPSPLQEETHGACFLFFLLTALTLSLWSGGNFTTIFSSFFVTFSAASELRLFADVC